MIATAGYQQAFLWFGVAQGVLIFIMALFMVRPNPPAGVRPSPRVVTTKVDYTTGQMIKTPQFWLIYVIFVAVAAGGLMVTAQIGPIAKNYGLDKLPMAFFGATVPLLTLTLSIDNLCNGFTRPLCGFISDRLGRENTMFFVFLGEGLAMLGLMQYGHDPVAFITFAALIFLFWGEIFSIFPSICADTYGIKFAAGNAGTLYTAKGTASLLVPLASVLYAGNGNWDMVFIVGASISIAAAFAAKFLLAPMRKRFIENANSTGMAG